MPHFFQMLNTCINDAFGMLFLNILIMKRKGYFFHQIKIFPQKRCAYKYSYQPMNWLTSNLYFFFNYSHVVQRIKVKKY